MRNNKTTVVQEYHKQWEDKNVRPSCVEMHISVTWYTIDEQPNWHPSLHARISHVKENYYKGQINTIYETLGIADDLDVLWYDQIWLKYVGEKMPRLEKNYTDSQVCRPNTIFDQPKDLIEVLKLYEKDSRTKKFVCGTGKFWVESHNEYCGRKEEIQIDPNPDLEEISSMVMLFQNKEEAKEWIEEVMNQVSGFSKQQIKDNKSIYIETNYSDIEEEEESPILIRLKKLLCLVADNSKHFCKKENRDQLEWVMWQFSNIFYAARHTGQGYDDSLMYFMDSFSEEWSKKLSEKEINIIHLATGSKNMLQEFGYQKINPKGSDILSPMQIEKLQNSPIPEITFLIAKENKTFEEHVKIYETVYSLSNPDMLLTYYGGYKFEKGYLVSEKVLEHDPFFVHGWKKIPSELLQKLNEIIKDPIILTCQENGRKEYELDIVHFFKEQYLKHASKKQKETMEHFDFEQWMEFDKDFTKLYLEEEDKKKPKKKEEYHLILGINPIINKVTKDSHPSYIKATIDICKKSLNSKKTSKEDRAYVKKILKKLE